MSHKLSKTPRPAISQSSSFGYVTLFLILAVISPPFLRLPFDPWLHLIMIRRCFTTGTVVPWDTFAGHSTTYPQFWHYLWARIFRLLAINDALIWAEVIHHTQAFLALCLVFFGSRLIISRLLPLDSRRWKAHLAALATALWLFGNGTSSLGVQQSWIAWYGITPQGLCLPLFWYTYFLGLTLIGREQLARSRWFSFALIGLVCGFIFFAHPLELAYLLINGVVLTMLLIRNRRFQAVAIVLCLGIMLAISFTPNFRHIFTQSEVFSDTSTFSRIAKHVVASNRFSSVFNSISLLSLLLSLGLIFLYAKPSNRSRVSRGQAPILLGLGISSITFLVIPTVWPLAGIVSGLTHPDLVWRFFYATPWFLALPVLICVILTSKDLASRPASLLGVFALVLVVYSGIAGHFLPWQNFNTTRNFCSVGFCDRDGLKLQYSSAELIRLKSIIDTAVELDSDVGLERDSRPVVLDIEGERGYVAAALWGYQVLQEKFTPLTDQEKAQFISDFRIVRVTEPLGLEN